MGNEESAGGGWLISYISRNDLIKPFIQLNDKTPIWDGFVFLYSNPIKDNASFLGRVPVQAKGTFTQCLSQFALTYSFSLIDYKSYLSDGGILLFVVQIHGYDQKVFYRFLLPSDLKKIISDAESKDVESVSIELRELTQGVMDVFHVQCENFLINRKMQFSTIDIPLDIKEAEEYKVHFSCLPGEESSYLLSNEIPLYGIKKGESIERFIKNVRFSKIERKIDESITINSKCYFDNFEIVEKSNIKIVKFSDNIQLNLINGELSFQLNGLISKQLSDLSFIKDLIKFRCVNIGNQSITEIDFTDQTIGFIEKIDTLYKSIQEISSLLSYFNIEPDLLDTSNLSKEDTDLLHALARVVLYNENVQGFNYRIGINGAVIGNITIALLIYKKDNQEKILIQNLFSPLNDITFSVRKEGEDFVPVSVYTLLKKDLILRANNFDPEMIFNDLNKIQYCATFGIFVNLLGLELLKAYDESLNEVFLGTAKKIFVWLIEKEPQNPIFLINDFQANRRIKEFTDIEKTSLQDLLVCNRGNSKILCGINILLENQAEAEKYFLLLDDKDKKEFKSYPIYKLGKKFGYFKE